MPEKISNAQVAQLHKLASGTLRKLAQDNQTLRTQNAELVEKVAGFEKKARAEKIAQAMEAKGINSDQNLQQKIAELMTRDNLDVIEEAVTLSAPQTKLASVVEDVETSTDEKTGDEAADSATDKFASALASIGA